jgi:hypothetical protein
MEPSAILMFVVFVAFGAALALATLWEKRRARRIESDLKQQYERGRWLRRGQRGRPRGQAKRSRN